jgi:prolyl 4-hydroxylase
MILERLSDAPLIVRIHDFVTDAEREHLKRIAGSRLARSTVQAERQKHEESEQRTSSTAFLNTAEDDVVRAIEQRATNLCGYPSENLEPLQILRYEPGQRYDAHHDYFPREQLGSSGQRHVTYFVYLSDAEDGLQGGETEFPKLQLKVAPRKNSAVFWYNCDAAGKELESTFHGGLAPTKGEKWGMNIWIRERKAR